MYYSLNGSYPAELPDRIRLSDGLTRTNKSTFTDEEIADAGYTAVSASPSYNSTTEKVEWNSSIADWEVVSLTEEEIAAEEEKRWNSIRVERNRLLRESDYIVLRHYELNETVPQNLVEYRQALRDIPQTYTTIEDIQFPTLPT